MLDVVFVFVFARRDQSKAAHWIRSGKKANFAGGVAGGRQNQKSAAATAFNFYAEALVFFLQQKRIGLVGAEDVAVKLIRALGGLVFDGVKERAIVGRPGGAGGAFDALRKRFAGSQILDLQRVLAKAGYVGRVSQQFVVVAYVENPKAEEG